MHLFRRMDGLNVLVDSEIPRPELWSAAPRQLSVALTNACDLRCSYCYAPKYKATLSARNVLTWLRELDGAGCLGVGFGGGEPTIHPSFTAICRQAAATTGLAVTFTTHAHRITREMCSELAGSVHFIRVSMDGVGATYERLRSRPYPALLERLKLVRLISPFGINFVVNAETIGDLDEAIEVAAGAGASELLLLPERPVRSRPGIDGATALQLRDWVWNYRGHLRLAVSEAGSEGLPVSDPLGRERGLRAFAHIDAAGTLKPNSFSSVGVAIDDGGPLMAVKRLAEMLERGDA